MNFLMNIRKILPNYINKIYLRDYKYNYTRCLNYSIDDLNKTLITDKENYNKYIIYQNKLQMCNKVKQKNIKISDIDTIKLKLEDDTSFSVMYELFGGANAKIEHGPGMSKDRFLQDIDALRVVLGDNKKYNIEFIYQDKNEKCIKQINIVEIDN